MSGNAKEINKNIQGQQSQALANQNQIFQLASQPSAGQKRFDEQSTNWADWLDAKDYSHGPKGSLLNFNLAQPAHVAQQTERMANLQGVGAANMGGNDSTALQLSKQHGAAAAAQDAGAEYEGAVAGQDAYFKNSALPWANSENAKWGNLFGQTSSNVNSLNNAYMNTKTESLWPTIIGAGVKIASSFI